MKMRRNDGLGRPYARSGHIVGRRFRFVNPEILLRWIDMKKSSMITSPSLSSPGALQAAACTCWPACFRLLPNANPIWMPAFTPTPRLVSVTNRVFCRQRDGRHHRLGFGRVDRRAERAWPDL